MFIVNLLTLFPQGDRAPGHAGGWARDIKTAQVVAVPAAGAREGEAWPHGGLGLGLAGPHPRAGAAAPPRAGVPPPGESRVHACVEQLGQGRSRRWANKQGGGLMSEHVWGWP